MDPNSSHQLWSKWTFSIREAGKRPAHEDVDTNVRRWIARGFGHAGTAKVSRTVLGWRIDLLIEGPPAHDPAYVASVRSHFQSDFVAQGFSMFATSDVKAKVMAGDLQEGKPRPQLVIMDSRRLEANG